MEKVVFQCLPSPSGSGEGCPARSFCPVCLELSEGLGGSLHMWEWCSVLGSRHLGYGSRAAGDFILVGGTSVVASGSGHWNTGGRGGSTGMCFLPVLKAGTPGCFVTLKGCSSSQQPLHTLHDGGGRIVSRSSRSRCPVHQPGPGKRGAAVPFSSY